MSEKDKQAAYAEMRQLNEKIRGAKIGNPEIPKWKRQAEDLQSKIHFGSKIPQASRDFRCLDCKGTLVGAYRVAAFGHQRCDKCYFTKTGSWPGTYCRGCAYKDAAYDMSADNGVCEGCFNSKRFEKEPVTEQSLANHFFHKYPVKH